MNEHTEPLRECPFCLGEAEIISATDHTWLVACTECANGTDWHESVDIAVIRWNTRAAQERVKELEQQLDTASHNAKHYANMTIELEADVAEKRRELTEVFDALVKTETQLAAASDAKPATAMPESVREVMQRGLARYRSVVLDGNPLSYISYPRQVELDLISEAYTWLNGAPTAKPAAMPIDAIRKWLDNSISECDEDEWQEVHDAKREVRRWLKSLDDAPQATSAVLPDDVRQAIIEITRWVDDWTKDGDDGFDSLAADCHRIWQWLDGAGAQEGDA